MLQFWNNIKDLQQNTQLFSNIQEKPLVPVIVRNRLARSDKHRGHVDVTVLTARVLFLVSVKEKLLLIILVIVLSFVVYLLCEKK